MCVYVCVESRDASIKFCDKLRQANATGTPNCFYPTDLIYKALRSNIPVTVTRLLKGLFQSYFSKNQVTFFSTVLKKHQTTAKNVYFGCVLEILS